MARNVRLDFRRGGGSSLEVLYGKVSLTPTNLHTLSSTAVLPAPTTFDLVNGTALATNVAPTPAPVDGLLPWGYKVKITDNFGKTWEYLVGVPDGTTEINFNVLPRYSESRPPAFGVGPAGPAGQSATIAIGTTTSGVTPAVTNTGTSTDAVLNFQLPKGDKGDTGVGVPTGGTALQVVRKNAGNTATEWATLTKSLVGLGNVDNTSDANKPVSTATQTAIDVVANSNKYPNSQAILDLAIADGWLSVYDPGNTPTVSLLGGVVQEVRDGLGNSTPLLKESTTPVTFTEGNVPQLTGGTLYSSSLGGGMSENFGVMILTDTSIVPGGGNQYLTGGTGESSRINIGVSSTGNMIYGNGVVNTSGTANQRQLQLVEVLRAGDASVASVGGNYSLRGRMSTIGVPTNLRLGGFSNTGNRWTGSFGLTLVHTAPTPDIMSRMRELVTGIYRLPETTPSFVPEARSLTVDMLGNVVSCNGDPDLIMGSTIMSITKIITALTSREFLDTDAKLDQTLTIVADDMFRGGTDTLFQVGDIVRYRELLYAMALPSNNLAPRALARRVAEVYIPGEFEPVKRYLNKLNANLAAWGYRGANSTAVGGGGKLSMRQVSDVVKRMGADPALRQIFGTRTHILDIGGPNARVVTIRHTIDSGTATLYPFNEFIAGKTGTGANRQSVASLWRDSGGTEYITVILGVFEDEPTHNRYVEMYKSITATKNRVHYLEYATNDLTGIPEQSTGTLDITNIFTGIERSAYAGSGIYVIRTGTVVTYSFYDVLLTTASYSELSFLPVWARPHSDLFGTFVVNTSNLARQVRFSSGGSVQVVGNDAGEIVRGTVTFAVTSTTDFPSPPFPGFVQQRT